MKEELLVNISNQLQTLIDMHINISNQLQTLIDMLNEETKKQPGKIGRPSKGHVVARFQEVYPNFTKNQCVQITGLTFKTVSKYWDV